MRIDNIIQYVNDLLRKEQKGYRDPDQIVRHINRGQWRAFNYYMPLYPVNSEAKEALAPFVKAVQYATDANGDYSIAVPEGFQGLMGIGVQYMENGKLRFKPVEFPSELELPSRKDSQLLAPTATDPIGEYTGFGSFKLFPAGVYAGTLYCVRKPKDVVYAITQNGRVFTYNNDASVQLEWAEKYQDKIIMAALVTLGLTMTDELAMQVSEGLAKIK